MDLNEILQYIDAREADTQRRIEQLEAQVATLELQSADKASALLAAFSLDDLAESVDSLALPVASLDDLLRLERELVNAGITAPAAMRIMEGDNARQDQTSVWLWDRSRMVWIVLTGATVSPVYVPPAATTFLIEHSPSVGISSQEVAGGQYQTFLAPARAESIVSASIYATAPAAVTVEARIETVDNRGDATGTLVAVGALKQRSIAQLSAFTWYEFEFDHPVSVSASVQYALKIIEKSGGRMDWALDDDGGYAGGGSSAGGAKDFVFRIVGKLRAV